MLPLPGDPPKDCDRCARLVAFRKANRKAEPDWYNGAVPSFGDAKARLVVVGLAPGRAGANRTGRPFTGDYAGDLLYATLLRLGLAHGNYAQRADDGLELSGAAITNAVRCVPPENKPTPEEIKTCNTYLIASFKALGRACAILALGRIAHDAVIRAFGLRLSAHRFAHGAEHALGEQLHLIDSFHCSRLNTNTGRLTAEMFEVVVKRAKVLAGL